MTAAPSRLPAPSASAGAIVARDVRHAYGDQLVLDQLSLTAPRGRRLALVGDNGSGKSTLLRLLAGVEQPLAGTITRPPDAALLEQELVRPPHTTIGEIVEEALAELREAARRVQELSALVQRLPHDRSLAREYGDALEWAQLREAWDADHRVDRVLRGLALSRYPRSRPIGELSGGERARVAMAALLVQQPGALLLDEPTNHLDDAAMEFLERHLRALPGVVVVASHDRAFLDAVCTDIVDLDPVRGRFARFGGSFSDYMVERRRERRRWERAWLERQAELRALERTLEGSAQRVGHARPRRDNDKSAHNFAGARVERGVSRRVRNTRGRIEQLERHPIPRPPDPLRFTATLGRVAVEDEPLLVLSDAAVEGRLAPTTLVVRPGGRLLVTGPNGAGKSTLLELLSGALTHTGGQLRRREGVSAGMLAQDPRLANLDATPRRAYADAIPARPGVPALEELGLLRDRDLDRPLRVLSEGQRRRVALALLVARSPELLLLDEPTNHLSPALVDELEEALLAAPCAVVVATHDRWLRARWAGAELRLAAPGQDAP